MREKPGGYKSNCSLHIWICRKDFVFTGCDGYSEVWGNNWRDKLKTINFFRVTTSKRKAEYCNPCCFIWSYFLLCNLSQVRLRSDEGAQMWGLWASSLRLFFKTHPVFALPKVYSVSMRFHVRASNWLHPVLSKDRWWNDTLLLSQAVSQEATGAWWENGWRLVWSTLSLSLYFIFFIFVTSAGTSFPYVYQCYVMYIYSHKCI